MMLNEVLLEAASSCRAISPSLFRFVAPAKCPGYLRAWLQHALSRGSFLVAKGRAGALIEPVPFDSECFGQLMGKLTWAWVPPGNSDDLVSAVLSEVRQHGLTHLTVRLDASHIWLVQALERNGFYMVDTQAMLARPLPADDAYLMSRCFEVSPFRPQDIDCIQLISSDAFKLSRFYTDPNLPTQSVEELHRRWVADDCNGRADSVLVARDGECILGYIACLYHPAEPEFGLPAQSEIDLIAVSSEARGRGVGTGLVEAALDHYSDQAARMTVETQGNNYPALNLYMKCGFRWITLAVTLHWFAGGRL